MKKIGIGKSHGKIILMGEHAVVYGYPALALPLEHIEVTSRIYPARRPLYNRGDALSMALFAALDYLGQTHAPIRYKVDSMVPSKRGMGSSAAVSIAAIRSVFDYFERDLPEELLENLVNQAEKVAHLNPSGLDAKTCLSKKAIKFVREVGFEELTLDLSAYLVIADTGVYGQTREAIQKVRDKGERGQVHLAQLGHLTEQVVTAIAEKNLPAMGQAMSQAHQELRQLGVSCPESDRLVKEAITQGALGAKMSGGGLGGCIIALVKSKEEAQQLAHLLREKGAVKTWIQSL